MHIRFSDDPTLLQFDVTDTASHFQDSIDTWPSDAAPRYSTTASLDALLLAGQLWLVIIGQLPSRGLATQQRTTVTDVCHGQLSTVSDDANSRSASA